MKKIFLMTAVVSLLVSGCVRSSAYGKLEQWTTLGGKTIPDAEMGDKQSRVVFLREEGAIDGPAVNIFVDGDYLTSLLDGGYRSSVVCSYGEQVLPAFSRSDSFADRDTGVDYNFVTGETAYVKVVSDDMGQPIFQRIDNADGEALIASMHEETQTLPRVKPNRLCEKIVLEKITLQANALFEFDKSNYNNMLPEGRDQIADVGERIRNSNAKVSDVQVTGYTDPMGTKQYNLELSKRRAATVKQALMNAGVTADIQSEGLGESNLLVRDCLERYRGDRKARMACDQPNRRVEIVLYGEAERVE